MRQQRLTTTIAWLVLGTCSTLTSPTTSVWADSPTAAVDVSNTAADTPEQRAAMAIQSGKDRSADAVSQLADWLADDNTIVRQSAAWALTQLGDAAEPALKPLIQAVSDRDARVRWAAATTLGHLGKKAEDAEAALVRAVHDRDADVQCAAIIALRSIEITDERKVSAALSDCLKDESSDVQAEALATLAALMPRCDETTKQDLVPRLTKALSTKNDEVRLATVVLLGDLGLAAAPAIAPLTRAANDLDEYVESAAIRTLNLLADEIDQRWNRLDPSQRETLQHSCEMAARELSAHAHESTDKTREQLAVRYRQLIEGIQLAAKEHPKGHVAGTKSDALTFAHASGQALNSSDVPLDDEGTNQNKTKATVTAAKGSRELWVWGLFAIIVGVGYWLLRRFIRRINDASQPASVTAHTQHGETTIASNAPGHHTLSRSADEDQLIAHVVPAVVASLPAGTAEDDVSVPVSAQDRVTEKLRSAVPSVSKELERSRATDVVTRREAVNVLSDIALDVTARLNRAMQDDDSVVRWRSASAVTAAHGATVPQLLAATTSADPEVRRLAMTSLQGLGGEAVIPFVQALRDQNADVRHAAATALGRIGLGAIDAIPQLIAALQDADDRVRASAAFSLSTFGRHAFEAVPALQRALSDSSPAVRSRAAFTLGQVGPAARRAVKELARSVSDPDATVRRNSASALGGIGTDAAVALPELLQATHDTDASVRRYAVSVIGLIAPSTAADALKRALSDTDAEVRECARTALLASSNATLKVFQPDEAGDVYELIVALQCTTNDDTRWNASQALVKHGGRAVPAIIAALPNPDPELRRQLIHALGRIGKEARAAVPALQQAMQDYDAQVRATAADSLGRMGFVNPAMLQSLTQALSDHDAEVRRIAATTLGRFGQHAHNAAIDLQVVALGDPEAKVRNAAQSALQRMTESQSKAA